MKGNRMHAALAAVAAIAISGPGAGPARAQENPRAFCARLGTDDTLRLPPASLEEALKHLFGVNGKYALESSYYRCAGGKVMLCTVGANLPCGKADMRKELPPADAWCGKNPNSTFIPMVVTGHDTPYDWRCVGGKAVAGGPVAKIDARGFFAENWKEVK